MASYVLNIIKSLIESGHDDTNKTKVVPALLTKVQASWSDSDVSNLYSLGIGYLLDETQPLGYRKYGEMILRRISMTHPSWFGGLFQEPSSFLCFFQDKQGDSLARSFDTTALLISLIKDMEPSKDMSKFIGLVLAVASHLIESDEIETTPLLQEAIADVLLRFYLPPLRDNLFSFETVLTWLSNTNTSMPNYLKRWDLFSSLCEKIVQSSSLGSFKDFVTVLCYLISTTSNISCGPLRLLSRPQLYKSLNKFHFSQLIQTGGSSVAMDLIRVLSRLSSWPLTKGSVTWYECIVDSLADSEQHLLYRLLPEYLPTVATQMFVSECRSHAFKLVDKILMCAQASPSLFLSLLNIQKTPTLIELFNEYIPYRDSLHQITMPPKSPEATHITQQLIESVEASRAEQNPKIRGHKADSYSGITSFIERLSRLCFIQIHMHGGYPEQYIPLIRSIRGLWAPPSESEMDEYKKCFAPWLSYSFDDATFQLEDTPSLPQVRPISDAASTAVVSRQHMQSGIINAGNNCYMNSFLQAIYHTTGFRQMLIGRDCLGKVSSDPKKKPTPKSIDVVNSLRQIFGVMLQGIRPAADPYLLKRALGDVWSGNGQQDAYEFGLVLLDNLDTFSPALVECFSGKFIQKITCTSCKSTSTRNDTFNSLTLVFPEDKGKSAVEIDSNEKAIPKERTHSDTTIYTLEDLLNHSFLPEVMDEDRKIFCSSESCKCLQEGEKTLNVEEGPDYLIINFASFFYDVASAERKKMLKKIEYKEELELPLYTPDAAKYCLYAVVIHSGLTAHSGHYYAYSRDIIPLPAQKTGFSTGLWYKLNDSLVGDSKFDNFARITESLSRDTPYLLFYVKEGVHVSEQTSLDPALVASIEADNAQYLRLLNEKKQTRQLASKFSLPTNHRRGPGGSGGGFGPGGGFGGAGGGGFGGGFDGFGGGPMIF